ncbi:MAG: hypothetical protein OEM00_12985 [Burkholderiaceae bacterium]|nr:hypothetical protein [Burkholderiaceae bacterium]MDH3461858.1 hypothetical protein [Burkholderiaceae bacterium]
MQPGPRRPAVQPEGATAMAPMRNAVLFAHVPMPITMGRAGRKFRHAPVQQLKPDEPWPHGCPPAVQLRVGIARWQGRGSRQARCLRAAQFDDAATLKYS